MEDNKQLPTAEEFIKNKIIERFPVIKTFGNRRFTLDEETAVVWAHEYAVLYARYCVSEALKAAIKEFNKIEIEPFNPSLKTLEYRIINAFNIEDIK